MKPSWKDAPKWAKYLAMDEDNLWTWYENKPELKEIGWREGSWRPSSGRMLCEIDTAGWRESLEERPSE